MTIRVGSYGSYIVPTQHWYIERTVWLIAGVVLVSSTVLALLVDPRFILGVTATGLVSINVALTGFCPVGNVLRLLGFKPMLGPRLQQSGIVLPASRSLVPRAPDLYRGRVQHLGCVDPDSGGEPVVLIVHPVRRWCHGVVCGNGLLHHGEFSVLARRRAAAQP